MDQAEKHTAIYDDKRIHSFRKGSGKLRVSFRSIFINKGGNSRKP